jgi:DNA-binding Xre family transcriptional regulator
MNGRVPITLDDLDELCGVLDIWPADLMPTPERIT